ncbi:H-2 class II histocompatibility antigen E-S beta chain-like [Crotalus adamanteus]|uniref:H-2 class II histocompatibility antigen E-S beta chain-like n=1 Tax=Crotalus adamanteus TaxID=8729 RepID=A0AAW1BT68_CROAD
MGSAGLPLMLLLLLAGALARIPGSEGGKETPAHFLLQWKLECHFFNGMQRVRFLDRSIYDRQEIDYFNSDLRKFVAVTPLGQPDVDMWNSDKVYLQYLRAEVDSVCRHNYRVYNYEVVKREERLIGRRGERGLPWEGGASTTLGDSQDWSDGGPERTFLQDEKARVDHFCRNNYEVFQSGPVIGRRAKPTVSISPTKLDPTSPNTILLCIVRGFYPVEIEVRWLKNGRPEEEGVAFGEELQNGDWTYQLHVMLETQPQRGDVYTCQVEHASLEAPITVQWEPRSSNSARSKVWTGIVAAVIGVIFFAMGLFLYLKSKKATPIQPPAALMN